MIDKRCIYTKGCKFFNYEILPELVKDIIIRRYCLSDFEKCERKKIRDKNQPVPDNLTPDGRRIGTK